MAKSNWDRIRKQKDEDKVKYRDVYEDQQLERSSMDEKQTMTSRIILDAIASVVVFAFVWFIYSAIVTAMTPKGIERPPDPSKVYVYYEEHYINNEDHDDVISVDEYEDLLLMYDPGWTKVEKPEEPDSSAEDYELLKIQYEQDLAAYEAYVKYSTDPAEKYTKLPALYRNRYDSSDYLFPDVYEEAKSKYEQDVIHKRVSDDILDVPLMPINPESVYIPIDYIDNVNILEDEDAPEKIPTRYRNRYDAKIISAMEYDTLKEQYDGDSESYVSAYKAHREAFHPDNVDGKAFVLDASFEMNKFITCLVFAAVTFALLYAVLKRNLDVVNQSSDVSDINQYHNDQHIALPQEIQQLYDWFPDVGAHSSVQVSSMISHMALNNKGIKTVELARRAKENIVNEDGDVEYYKGEILRDSDGNPLTDTVPLIDEQFMEDLFDASGAPRSKKVRMRYDARHIKYNPGNENRDKLQNKEKPYDTVADLINADWEFPIYEPQRPGGAYIVDTAPVNTMV